VIAIKQLLKFHSRHKQLASWKCISQKVWEP